MKVSTSFILSLFLYLFSSSLLAQRNCGAMDYLNQQIQKDPSRALQLDAIEKNTQQILKKGLPDVEGVITIPVVVHVIYNTAAQNISEAQILSQIQVLNDDFRRTNSDADNTWSQAADSEIEFCMATTDPNGNATNGITRTSTTVTSFGTNDNMKFDASGGKNAWPRDQYLNIWVCNIGGGILGYAQFPGGPANTDGVVCGYQYFGTTGTATSPFDLGRTTTHEVGHWLNLRHIWGDGNCSVDDFVSDTPNSDNPNYGCALGHTSCTSTDMVQNYMDYSDDACMNLYTTGQKSRMRALFDPSGARVSLLSSNGCGNASPPSCTDNIQNGDENGIDCGGTNCPPCQTNCSDNFVNLTLVLDNYPSETSWELQNESGNVLASGNGYNGPGATISEDFCLPDGCYTFVINDSYGDGICCSFGNGSYTLTDENNTTLVTGASFENTASTTFCLNTSTPTCSDGQQNGDENGIDCGGTNCPPCDTIATPTCSDGQQNGDENGIDCGGTNCPPCTSTGCNTNTIYFSITLDNYPTETSWEIKDEAGTVLFAGGNYQTNGATITDTFCLEDGCFDFVIYDSYGDGICCAYGQGSYSLTDVSGTILASGGSFTTTETKNICFGQIIATCSDSLQNGDENGIDCGGSNCPPCVTACANNTVTLALVLDNYPEETSWELADANGNVLYSGGNYSTVGENINEEFCLPDGCYSFSIFDSYGDGICCSYGQGSYALTDAGNNSLASGGDFNQNELTTFCVGNATPGGCQQNAVNINIQTDNYPGETTWELKDANGTVLASGGPYANSQDTYEEDVCLPDGCYEFYIYDSFGDGICCGYGQGSFTLTNLNDNSIIYSGGAFTNQASVDFCLPQQTATCSDNIQNGDENGIDCGGSNCPPCGEGCSYSVLFNNTFEYGWGIWDDGGSDCRRSSYDANYANSGVYCIRVRDNSFSSNFYTDDMDLTNYSEVTIDFSFIMAGMENGEGFHLEYSINDGNSYTIVHTVSTGNEYSNFVRYNESIVIQGPFSDKTQFRFRGTGSSDSDRTYFDDIVISGCVSNGRIAEPMISAPLNSNSVTSRSSIVATASTFDDEVRLFPNPASEKLQLIFHTGKEEKVQLLVTGLTGQVYHSEEKEMSAGFQQWELNVRNWETGIYFVHLIRGGQKSVHRFVVNH